MRDPENFPDAAFHLPCRRYAARRFLAFSILLAPCLSSCTAPQVTKSGKQAPPAVVQNAPKESELATIKLTPQAEQRLGITLTPVAYREVKASRVLGGDVMLLPDCRIVVLTPVGGALQEADSPPRAGMPVRKGQILFRLLPQVAPERDMRLQLEREVEAAKTRTEAARIRSERAEKLVQEKAGSAKMAQQAREELDLAKNDLNAARNRLERFLAAPLSADTSLAIAAPSEGIIQNVQVQPPQVVPSGTVLFEVIDLSAVWIRVPVYVGELETISVQSGAWIRGLADAPNTAGRLAKPVAAPPSADANASTADLYFLLSLFWEAW